MRSALGTLTSPVQHRVLGLLGNKQLSTKRVYRRFSIAKTSVSERLRVLGSTSLVEDGERKGFVCCRLGASMLRSIVL